jgi:hypothetical protein
VDGSYIEARAKGTGGYGTKQQPMLAAMDRVPASIRWAKDCSKDFWQVEDRSGCLKGISVGLSSFCRLAQKECDSFDGGASLP